MGFAGEREGLTSVVSVLPDRGRRTTPLRRETWLRSGRCSRRDRSRRITPRSRVRSQGPLRPGVSVPGSTGRLAVADYQS